MSYNTGNPIGSTDPRDAADNKENFDRFALSTDHTYLDRLGKSRKSLRGMEDEFVTTQADRAAQFSAFIAASGYEFVGDYAAGITLTQYNQVIRDPSGEFWRPSGSTALPHTTTGAGMPEGGSFVPVGDAALRQQLAQDNGYRLVADQMAPNAYGVPGPLTNVVTSTFSINPCGYFDGLLWGRDASNRLHSSSDMGATWSLVSSAANRVPIQAFRTADGEVLVQSSEGLSKSSGWAIDPATATWMTVLSRPSGNVADFLKWGVDGDGQKFIATHYSSTRADSRFVWISTDAGSTFNIVYDSNENDPVNGPSSHIHAACYDPWADRFYFTEGHGAIAGIYYSDNDGVNWTYVTTDLINGVPRDPAFTTMKATDFGIVCGTDGHPNGVWLLPRAQDPSQNPPKYMGSWSKNFEGVIGFADHSFRDPDTGIVYLGFISNFIQQGVPHVIMACGAAGASVVLSGTAGRYFSVFAAKGKLVAQVGTSTTWLRADTSKGVRFSEYLRAEDRGNLDLAGGEYTRNNSIKIGRGSTAIALNSIVVGIGSSAGNSPTAQNCIAVGSSSSAAGESSIVVGNSANDGGFARSVLIGSTASAEGSWGVAVGYSAKYTSTGGVAIGYLSSASTGVAVGERAICTGGLAAGNRASASGADSVALGRESACSGAWGVSLGYKSVVSSTEGIAIGRGANATGGMSIGRLATSVTESAVAVGRSAKAETIGTVAFGDNAIASAGYSVAIGQNAAASNVDSIALGRNAQTQRSFSLSIGDRDFESTKNGGGIYLKSPDGTLYKLTIANGGTVSVSAV